MNRRQGVAVLGTVVLVAAAVVTTTGAWRLVSERDPSTAVVARGTVPAAAPAPQAPAPAAAPAPLVGPTREVGPGRALRLGYARPPALPALVADAVGPSVGLYNAPGDAEPAESASNPTWEGLPLVFLVQQRWTDWLEVQVAMRPNEATAWIKAADVTLREVVHRVVIDLGARKLTAYQGAAPVLEATVAIGDSGTPTPTGNYFIDGAVKVPDPNGPYGAYQLSVAAFSNVHFSFGGGVGQIAIHGTNNPALIGTPASNGCVRMTNPDVTRLVGLVPVGTPVQIIG